MLFSSIVFLFTFLPIILILYYVLPKGMKNPVLLLGSLIFYAWGEPIYLFLMIFPSSLTTSADWIFPEIWAIRKQRGKVWCSM